MKRQITWHFDLTLDYRPRAWRGLLAVAMLFAAVGELASESVTLTTYYPAPSGVYSQLITTGNTYLARDTATNGGLVGVGTTAPGALMSIVNGDNSLNNILQVYPQNLTEGIALGYDYIREIGSNGNNSLLIDAQGSGTLNLQSVGTGGVNVSHGIAGSYGLVPSYAGWNSYGTGAGGAAIYNDNAGYKTLMVVGNNSGGGSRQVSVWDQLNVNGTANTTINLGVAGTPPGAEAYMYVNASGGNGSSCYYIATNNGACTPGMYITWVPGIYVDNGAWWYTGPNLNFSTVGTPLGNQTNITTTAPVYSCCWK